MRSLQRPIIDRPLVGVIVIGVLFWIALLVVFCHYVSYLEFVRARPSRLGDLDFLPNLSVLYYKLHRYDWIVLATLAGWGTWLIWTASRTPLAIAICLVVVVNIGTAWGLLTLLVIYMLNQTLVAAWSPG